MTLLSLIRNECANHFSIQCSIKNYCCLTDKTCVFFLENKPRCKYFEESVLPIKKDLEYKYRRGRNLRELIIQASCKNCSRLFIRKSKKEKYCDECKQVRKKQQKKLYMQKIRRAV